MVLQNLSLYKIKRRLKLTTQAARLTTYSRINTLFFSLESEALVINNKARDLFWLNTKAQSY